MIEDIISEEVIVSRPGKTPEVGHTTHMLYLDKRDAKGNIIGKGEYVATGVRIRGFDLYAQPDHLSPVSK